MSQVSFDYIRHDELSTYRTKFGLTLQCAKPTDWANGAPTNIDWNILGSKSTSRTNFFKSKEEHDAEDTLSRHIRKNVMGLIGRYKTANDDKMDDVLKSVKEVTVSEKELTKENYVTENVAEQIGFGENLLEVVYPGKFS